ncbi:hypothetical protein SCG7086_BL_00020 [Chlamydiales bacterium SCGC AG-110-P3]|nr:hypothetical protein SCG7086_BL_00020 [Chlamydiales bacterium SCGC AG-110-P3]
MEVASIFGNSLLRSTWSTVKTSAITSGLLLGVRHAGELLEKIQLKENNMPSWHQVALKITIRAALIFAIFSALVATSTLSALAGSLGGLLCAALAASPATTSFVTGIFSMCSMICSVVGWGGAIGWSIEPLMTNNWTHLKSNRDSPTPR